MGTKKLHQKEIVPMSYAESWEFVKEALLGRELLSAYKCFSKDPHHPKLQTLARLFRDTREELVELRHDQHHTGLVFARLLAKDLTKIYETISRGCTPWIESIPKGKVVPKNSLVVFEIPSKEFPEELYFAQEQVKKHGRILKGSHESSIEHLSTIALFRYITGNLFHPDFTEERICKYLCRSKDEIGPPYNFKSWERRSRPSQCMGPARMADWSLARFFGVNERAVMNVRKNRKVMPAGVSILDDEFDLTSLVGLLKNVFGRTPEQIQAGLESMGFSDFQGNIEDQVFDEEGHGKTSGPILK